jgi:hypothetical protein
MAFQCEIRSIGKIIVLSFHPYKARPKRSPYVISVMILVRTVPGIQINLSKSYSDLVSLFHYTTSNVVTWWKRREHLNLVPNPGVS